MTKDQSAQARNDAIEWADAALFSTCCWMASKNINDTNLMIGCQNGLIRVCSIAHRHIVMILDFYPHRSHPINALCVASSEPERHLLSAGYQSICLWDVLAATPLCVYQMADITALCA
eukprot:CAMPEP_0201558704 /NCGR_PEP_ID=MMETSP0173_2-20130828/69479_1 /ASSEMBLY_ACC=CAM_ASM_000268 /TAXON_ID=218659 /ORGANISM="Vexillifera sp., Strain DIVA3 564/2" /LENGTH=117 /DNA_ID=CAMNT_0047972269 /DNA_START=303 /DNA_END=652 /DNA_ORIENTATION=-